MYISIDIYMYIYCTADMHYTTSIMDLIACSKSSVAMIRTSVRTEKKSDSQHKHYGFSSFKVLSLVYNFTDHYPP